MKWLWTATILASVAILPACGGDDDSSSSGGTAGTSAAGTGGNTAGSGGSTAGTGGSTAGTGGGSLGGSGGGGIPACTSTFTATGTATPEGGDPIEVALSEPDGVQVVSGTTANTRFEALYASDMMLEKKYMGPDYSLLVDILDTQSDALDPADYDALGSHGASLSVKYAEGMWHTFTLELDTANGDFVKIEEGSTPLYEVEPSPQVKASYQLSFKSYMDMTGTTVDATGTLTGRFDGCYWRHNDTSGEYAE